MYVTPGVRTVDDLWTTEPVAVRDAFVSKGYARLAGLDGRRRRVRARTAMTTSVPSRVCPRRSATSWFSCSIRRLTASRPCRFFLDVEDLELSHGIATGYGERTVPGSEELLDQDEYHSTLHETSTAIERVAANEILTDAGENDSGTCYGDSGGPLYVQRGNELFVAGVLSRLRSDREPPRCGKGAIYTAIAPYQNWIFDVAPETIPFQSHGGGGCSVSSQSGARSGLWVLGLVLFVFCLPAARRRRPRVLILLAALSSMGCGSSGEASFCTERYDPLGVACDPEVERTDLYTAEALARVEVPEDAWLWEVRSSYSHVDPDGNAMDWALTYYLPQEVELPPGRLSRSTCAGRRSMSPSGPTTLSCTASQRGRSSRSIRGRSFTTRSDVSRTPGSPCRSEIPTTWVWFKTIDALAHRSGSMGHPTRFRGLLRGGLRRVRGVPQGPVFGVAPVILDCGGRPRIAKGARRAHVS